MTKREAICRYSTAEDIQPDGDSCYSITPKLIVGDALSPAQTKLVEALDAAFNGSVTKKDLLLFRGASKLFIDAIHNSDNGTYPSYVSTSKDLSESLRFLAEHGDDAVLLKIHCPAGSPCIDLSEAQVEMLEQAEVLLPRNTRFSIEPWNPNEEFPPDQLTLEQQLILEINPAPAYCRLEVVL